MFFYNKELSKVIIKRSRLRNNFLKIKTHGDSVLLCITVKYCVSLIRKFKPIYFKNLDEKKLRARSFFRKLQKLHFLINYSPKIELI